MINSDENYLDFNLGKNPTKEDGLVGFFVLDKTGLLYFSKVAENKMSLAQNTFQIAAFISVIMIYSRDLIGSEEAGIKLEDINLGNHHFYVYTKENVIFAYFVEKNKISNKFKSYITIIIKNFIENYWKFIKKFKGELKPFSNFEKIIDQYFDI